MEYNKDKNIFYEIDYLNKVVFYENELSCNFDETFSKINLKNMELKQAIMKKYNFDSLPALLYYKKTIYPDKEEISYDKDQLLVEEIKRIIFNNKIVLFMKGDVYNPYCQFSKKVVNILQNAGVELDNVVYYDVLMNDEMREKIKEYNEWPTFPQLFVNGEFVGGCDILKSMEGTNELKDLLNKTV